MGFPGRGAKSPQILIIQNSDRAPGGNFCRSLEQYGARLSTCAPAIGENLPAGPDNHQGLVVLGGPQYAGDDAGQPYFAPLMALMRDFAAAGKPVAGICLGSQLLARAHGGQVLRSGHFEFGFIRHQFTSQGEQDPVVGHQKLPALMAFHEDSFQLPEGAALLIQGHIRCPNQCFRIGEVSYGFQFHLEIDSATYSTWFDLFKKGGIEAYRPYRDQIGQGYLREQFSRSDICLRESDTFCDRVAKHWLKLAI